jgi:signal transduction histidine kinase
MKVRSARTALGVDDFARTIADIAQALESPKDADPRIAHVLALIGTLVPNDRCAILRRAADGQTHVIQVPAADDENPNLTALLESLLHFTEGDAEGHRPFQSSAHLAVPVIGCDEIIGVLLVERDTGDDFEAHHLRCLTAIASQLGSYLILEKLQEESARTARFREEFIGVIGHDLRNPVSAILTGAHALLKRNTLSAADAAIARRIATSSQRVAHMIEDLSDFTRGRLGGGIRIVRGAANLRDICGRVVEELQITHPGSSIVLRANRDLSGEWDADRLSQVVSNLLSNALEHGTPGTPVRVELSGHSNAVTIQVVNQGRTIAPDELDTLFEPFRRGRDTHSSPRRGLGLGLYIVERIVSAHEGTVTAASGDDGTRFTVTLPRTA